jgi:asparagine synthetase B (glutamine-hydrolysing)
LIQERQSTVKLTFLGLGHVRLSIVDLSPDGNQPFVDTENEIYTVVNGELYDHERYRAELSTEYNFRGHSDCEIVLALYKHYGLDFLSHLRGEFALVLWDARRQIFIATRDRYGVKSLYYTISGGRLLVATEMKQFLAYGWEAEWDVRSVVEKGLIFDERTVFEGVKKVCRSLHWGSVRIVADMGRSYLGNIWSVATMERSRRRSTGTCNTRTRYTTLSFRLSEQPLCLTDVVHKRDPDRRRNG